MAVAISLLSSWEIAIDSPIVGYLKVAAWLGRGGMLHSRCYVGVKSMLINPNACLGDTYFPDQFARIFH